VSLAHIVNAVPTWGWVVAAVWALWCWLDLDEADERGWFGSLTRWGAFSFVVLFGLLANDAHDRAQVEQCAQVELCRSNQ
jgi:hypothetical protein